MIMWQLPWQSEVVQKVFCVRAGDLFLARNPASLSPERYSSSDSPVHCISVLDMNRHLRSFESNAGVSLFHFEPLEFTHKWSLKGVSEGTTISGGGATDERHSIRYKQFDYNSTSTRLTNPDRITKIPHMRPGTPVCLVFRRHPTSGVVLMSIVPGDSRSDVYRRYSGTDGKARMAPMIRLGTLTKETTSETPKKFHVKLCVGVLDNPNSDYKCQTLYYD